MIFLVGPRQVGKTYLAKEIAKEFTESLYLNYDSLRDRAIIQQESWLPSVELLILDELHKMPEWKNYLKGLYDTKPASLKIVVTGSARLEVYQKIGDSLAGRYFIHHLLPFSIAELAQLKQPLDVDRLMVRGGFPEAYLSESDLAAKRWRMQYTESLIATDVLDFETIHNVRAMRTVFELLRARVGSPISYQSLSEDAAISPITVKRYIDILESLYIVFRVTPFAKNIARSLLKEPKIYFFDTGLVQGDDGQRFENLVAVSLLKHVYAKRDLEGSDSALHYLRTKDQQEVDFVLTHAGEIERCVEAKLGDVELSRALQHFAVRYQLPATQVVKNLKHERQIAEIPVVTGLRFLRELRL